MYGVDVNLVFTKRMHRVHKGRVLYFDDGRIWHVTCLCGLTVDLNGNVNGFPVIDDFNEKSINCPYCLEYMAVIRRVHSTGESAYFYRDSIYFIKPSLIGVKRV